MVQKNKPTPFFNYHFLDRRMGVWHIQSFRELQEADAKKKNPFFVHELSIGFDKQSDDQSGKEGGGGGCCNNTTTTSCGGHHPS
jgi:hypothetical protein